MRCTLAGISQPGFRHNAGGIGASRFAMKYPYEINNYLKPLNGKEVMIFCLDWYSGEAGYVKHSNENELLTVSVL